jgi:hypothetical protein
MAYVEGNRASWEAEKASSAGDAAAGLFGIAADLAGAAVSAHQAKENTEAQHAANVAGAEWEGYAASMMQNEDPSQWQQLSKQFWDSQIGQAKSTEHISRRAARLRTDALSQMRDLSLTKVGQSVVARNVQDLHANTDMNVADLWASDDISAFEISVLGPSDGGGALADSQAGFIGFDDRSAYGTTSPDDATSATEGISDRARYDGIQGAFDRKMHLSELMYRQAYPNNPTAVRAKLAEIEPKARASQLELDMKMLYGNEVGTGEMGYIDFLNSYETDLKSVEYGGNVLSDVERREAMDKAQQYVQQQYTLERGREVLAFQSGFIPEYLQMVKSGKPILPETLDEMFSRHNLNASLLFDEYTSLRVTAESNDQSRKGAELATLLAKRDQLIIGSGDTVDAQAAGEAQALNEQIAELEGTLPKKVVDDVKDRHQRVVDNAYSSFASERVPTVYSMLMHDFFTNKDKSAEDCRIQLDLYASLGLVEEQDYLGFKKMLENGGRDPYLDEAYTRSRDALLADVKKSLGDSSTAFETFRPMILESFHSAVVSSGRNGFVDYAAVTTNVKQQWVDQPYASRFNQINDFLYKDYFGEVTSTTLGFTSINDFGKFMRDYQSGMWDSLRVPTRFAAVMGEQTKDNPFGRNLYNLLKNSTYTDEQSARLVLLSFAKDAGLAIPENLNIDAKGLLGTGLWDSFDSTMSALLNKAPVPLKNYIMYNTALAVSALEVQKAFGSTIRDPLGVISTGLKRMSFDGNTIGVVGDDGLVYDMRVGNGTGEAQWFVRKYGQDSSEAVMLTGLGYLKEHSPQSIASDLEMALNTRLASYSTTGLSENDYNALMAQIYKDHTAVGEGAQLVGAFRTYETTYNSVMRARATLIGKEDEFIPVSVKYKPTFSNHTNSMRKFTVSIQQP